MLPRRMNLSFSIAIPDFSCSVTSWLMLLLLWLKYLNISLMDRAKICCRLSWYPEDGCMPITFVIFLTVHLEFKQIKASTLRWEILSQQTSQNAQTVKTQTNDSHSIKSCHLIDSLQCLPFEITSLRNISYFCCSPYLQASALQSKIQERRGSLQG